MKKLSIVILCLTWALPASSFPFRQQPKSNQMDLIPACSPPPPLQPKRTVLEVLGFGGKANITGYDILGVPYGAGPDACSKAYKKLAAQWHPDKNHTPEADDVFKLIGAANEYPNQIFDAEGKRPSRTIVSDSFGNSTVDKADTLRTLKAFLAGCLAIAFFERHQILTSIAVIKRKCSQEKRNG